MIRGVLFNTEMVKAILAGRKTVTRRLIKPQPPSDSAYLRYIKDGIARFGWEHSTALCDCKLPYQIGDVLYVRETWCKGSLNGGTEQYFYKADNGDFHCQWRPSIHMPKEAARIFLRVTDVRVERLQDMTIDDCIKEGSNGIICPECSGDGCPLCAHSGWWLNPKSEFIDIWNSTIKKADLDKCGWKANPWVFVISFERISKEDIE